MAYSLQGSAQIACAVDAATAITNGGGRSSAKLAGVCVTPRCYAPAAGQTAALASRIQTDNPIAALSVPRGREEACARRIRAAAGSSASEVFVLARECARSHAGAWELVREPAYPGSVFAAVRDAEAFVERVDTPAFAALGIHLITTQSALGTPEPRFLSQREADFVRRIGDARHVIRMSVGDVVEGRLVVHEGALVGCEGLVAHVDRHRRSAWLQAADPVLRDASGRGLRVGLEVVSKS